MNLSAFSLRDYVLYLFPGVALALCCALVRPDLWDIAKESPALASLGVLTLGYAAGFAGRQVGLVLFKPVLDRLIGNPFSNTLGLDDESAATAFGKGLTSAIVDELRQTWPASLLDNEKEASILFLCQRQIEVKEHQGLGNLERLVALYGLALNLMLPALLLAIILLIQRDYPMAAVAFLAFAAFARAHLKYRQAYARNVYRIWFVLRRQERLDET